MLEHLGLRCVVIFALHHEAEATENNHPKHSDSIRFDSCDFVMGGYAIGAIHTTHEPWRRTSWMGL